jgi:flagellar L-ring protein precursor FlgH
MKDRIVLVLILTVFLLCSANCSQADSIWAKRDKNMRDLYADDVARHIGDVLTITINETTKVANKTERDLSKKTKRTADFDGNVGIDHIITSIPGIHLGTGSEYENTLEGSAELKDNRSFIDSITVVVVDILPNGNLVVMGTRSRNIAGDIQNIEVSGIVRTSDIAFNNTVRSERVADFNIVTKTAGISESYNKPNWLGKVFDVIWPF